MFMEQFYTRLPASARNSRRSRAIDSAGCTHTPRNPPLATTPNSETPITSGCWALSRAAAFRYGAGCGIRFWPSSQQISNVTNHRLKAVATVTRAASRIAANGRHDVPAPSRLQEVDGLNRKQTQSEVTAEALDMAVKMIDLEAGALRLSAVKARTQRPPEAAPGSPSRP